MDPKPDRTAASCPVPGTLLTLALVLILAVTGTGIRAGTWESSDLMSPAFLGGGTASQLPWLLLNANPAGLAFLETSWGHGPAAAHTMGEEAFQAARDFIFSGGITSWRIYFEEGQNWESYRDNDPEFAAKIDEHAGRKHRYHTRLSVTEIVRKNFGVEVYGLLDKSYFHHRDEQGLPVPHFEANHRSGAGLKLGFGRQSHSWHGGQMAIGFAVDLLLYQEKHTLVTGPDNFNAAVWDDWFTFLNSDADFELDYGTRLGLQWLSNRILLDSYRPSLGLVLVDPVGSQAGHQRPARMAMGLALNSAHTFLPTLVLDHGGLQMGPGVWRDGTTLGICEDLGFLKVAAGTGKLAQRISAGLDMGFLNIQYMFTSVDDAALAAELGEDVHTLRVSLGSFGSSRSVVAATAGQDGGSPDE